MLSISKPLTSQDEVETIRLELWAKENTKKKDFCFELDTRSNLLGGSIARCYSTEQ